MREQKLQFGRLCKGERKYCTPVRVISDHGTTTMRLYNLLYDGETQSDTGSIDIPSSPKPFEYSLLYVDWHSGAAVGNIHATVRQHLYRHLFAQW